MTQGPPPGFGPPTGYYPPPPTDSKAIAALVCAIAAFVVCPVVPAIVALFLASASQSAIHASGGTLQGEGLLTAARIVAWANIVLFGLFLLLFLGLYA